MPYRHMQVIGLRQLQASVFFFERTQGFAVPVEDVKSRTHEGTMARNGRWSVKDSLCDSELCSVECQDKPVFSLFLSNLPW